MMFSQSIRDHSRRNKDLVPSILLKRETKLGIFNMTVVESVVVEDMEPFEWAVLACCKEFEKVTRLELHAVTGFSLKLIEEVIRGLLESGHLLRTRFDRHQLDLNIERIEKDLGDSWMNNEIRRILSRKMINQYELSPLGHSALKYGKKESQSFIDLNMIITAEPFKLFFDQVQLKQIALEEIDVTPDLVNKLFHLAREEGAKLENQIKPVALGGDSVVTGIEVNRADIWVPIEADDMDSPKISGNDRFEVYITSSAFIRWSNPPVSREISEILDLDIDMKGLVTEAMSDAFDMVEEVITDNLHLRPDKEEWEFHCDLEMLMLIREKMREPIENTSAEIFLTHESGWEVGLLLKLIPVDDLAEISLFAARFHSKVDRTGFTFDEGYQVWRLTLREAGYRTGTKQYMEALEVLTEYKALKKISTKVKGLVVDLDGYLGKNRKRHLPWNFSRIRELETFLKKADITDVYFYGTQRILDKIDDEDAFNAWKETVDFRLFEEYEDEDVSPAMRFAARNKLHYLGLFVPRINTDEEIRLMRIERRVLNYSYRRKLEIMDLEPMYHWYPVNIIELLYEKHYD